MDAQVTEPLAEAFVAAWEGRCDSDVFARLVPAVRLRASQVQLMRAVFAYLRQAGLGASRGSVVQILLKLDATAVPMSTGPPVTVETFVYHPDVEGLHVRCGRVARGGLRWSDRREDYRTEVMALVRAQQVKNAPIVPAGAKGVHAELLASDLPADPGLFPVLQDYFPAPLRERFAERIRRHPLATEIVATRVASDLIDRIGPGFLYRLEDRTGAPTPQAMRAYLIVRDVFGLERLWDRLDSSDLDIPFGADGRPRDPGTGPGTQRLLVASPHSSAARGGRGVGEVPTGGGRPAAVDDRARCPSRRGRGARAYRPGPAE